MVRKRGKIIKIHNKDFQNYSSPIKGLVFGGIIGLLILISSFVISLFDFIYSLDYIFLFIPIILLIGGAILGLLFFKKENRICQ